MIENSLDTLTEQQYLDLRYEIIKQLEESGTESEDIYTDGQGLVTIGVGFNVSDDAILDQVLQHGFGLSTATQNNPDFKPGKTFQGLATSILNLTQASHPANQDVTQLATLKSSLDALMVEYTTNVTEFSLAGPAIIESTFNEIAKGFELDLSTFLSGSSFDDTTRNATTNVNNMDYSYERLALISLQYNNNPSAGSPLLAVGNNLSTALENDNRIAAWYEIRYASNGGLEAERDGVAKRRYIESQLFDLYPENLTPAERDVFARNVHDFLLADQYPATPATRNIDQMIEYENARGHMISATGTQADIGAIDGLTLTVPKFQKAFLPIASDLAKYFGRDGLTDPDNMASADYQESQAILAAIGAMTFNGANDEVVIGLETDNLIKSTKHGTANDGNDVLIAVEDTGQSLSGGKGNDILIGAEGSDQLYGGDDNDLLIGNVGNDELFGQDGADALFGGYGNDLLSGGAGADQLDGGKGIDTVSYETSDAGVTVNLEDNTATGGHANGDTFNDIENIIGSDFDDRLQGNSEDNSLSGGAGDDIIMSTGGDDTLKGGKGNDILVIADDEAGLTTMGPYVGGDWNIQEVDGGSGDDDLFAQRILGSERTFVYGRGYGDDVLFAMGGVGTDQLAPNTSGTTVELRGLNRADVTFYRPDTFGSAFSQFEQTYQWDGVPILMRINDTGETLLMPFTFNTDSYTNTNLRADWKIQFEDGALTSGSLLGVESIRDDQLVYSFYRDAQERMLAAEQRISGGTERITGLQAGDFDFDSYTPGTKNDNLHLGNFDYPFFNTDWDQPVTETGTTGNDRLSGSRKNDNLSGGAGNDLLMGAKGDDILSGGDDNDTLWGDGGADTLNGGDDDDLLGGGRGNDTLTGGTGADKFVFSLGDGEDIITDAASEDRVALHGTLAADDRILQSDLKAERIGNDLILHYSAQDKITFTGWYSGQKIGGLDVFAGTTATALFTLTTQQIEDLVNVAPVLDNPIEDQSAIEGQLFNFTLPADTFSDMNVGDVLTLTATLDDGSALPAWLTFDPVTGIFSGTPDSNASGILAVKVTATDSEGAAVDDVFDLTVIDYNEQTGTVNDDVLQGNDGIDVIVGLAGNDTLQGLGGDDTLDGGEGDDILEGGDGDDTLNGGDGADFLDGGAGDDTMFVDVNSNGNIFYGGTGNDTMTGGQFYDAYIFSLGDGQDTINEQGGNANPIFNDDIFLGAGIATGDVQVTREGTDLLINVGIAGDQIRIKQWYESTLNRVENLRFDNGTVWDADMLNEMGLTVNGTSGDDTLIGLDGSENTLNGLEGDDLLIGGSQNDILNGGLGANTLFAGAGDDTTTVDVNSSGNLHFGGTGNDTLNGGQFFDFYYFNQGDGLDIINEQNGDTAATSYDWLNLDNMDKNSIWFSQNGDDLTIDYVGTNDQITIKDWYLDSANHVEIIYTADSVLFSTAVDQLVNAMAAFSVPTGVGAVIPQDVQDQINPVIAASWQAI